MKAINILAVLLMIGLSFACSKDGINNNSGTITGYDYGYCQCCGGYYIEINNEIYRIWNKIEETNFEFSDEELPLEVKVNWKKRENPCFNNEIIVQSIKKK